MAQNDNQKKFRNLLLEVTQKRGTKPLVTITDSDEFQEAVCVWPISLSEMASELRAIADWLDERGQQT